MKARQTREERIRRQKQYHARAYQNGGRTTVEADDLVPILRELNERMSLRAIGDAIGTSGSYVGRVIRGEIRTVGLERAAAIRAVRPTQPVPGGAYVSALASTRRLQALAALGYSAARLSTHLGLCVKTVKLLTAGRRTVMHGRTERHIATVFERLMMELPQAADKYEAGSITRTQRRAQREGWPPPFAWDNIDDPDEQPTDWAYVATDRGQVLRDMADMGFGITEAARRLHRSPNAIQKWCGNNGMSHVYRELAGREMRNGNQYAEEVA